MRLVVSLPNETEKEREDQNKLASDLIAFLDGPAKTERIGHVLYWSYASKQRPFAHIRAEIDRLSLLRSYQEPNKIEAAFKLIGCRSIFDGMAGGDKVVRAAMWKDLDEYSLRRNKIVHEGDRLRGKKAGRKARLMTERYVNRVIKRIDEIVELLELEIDKQLKAMKPAPKPRGRRPAKPKGRPRTSK